MKKITLAYEFLYFSAPWSIFAPGWWKFEVWKLSEWPLDLTGGVVNAPVHVYSALFRRASAILESPSGLSLAFDLISLTSLSNFGSIVPLLVRSMTISIRVSARLAKSAAWILLCGKTMNSARDVPRDLNIAHCWLVLCAT